MPRRRRGPRDDQVRRLEGPEEGFLDGLLADPADPVSRAAWRDYLLERDDPRADLLLALPELRAAPWTPFELEDLPRAAFPLPRLPAVAGGGLAAWSGLPAVAVFEEALDWYFGDPGLAGRFPGGLPPEVAPGGLALRRWARLCELRSLRLVPRGEVAHHASLSKRDHWGLGRHVSFRVDRALVVPAHATVGWRLETLAWSLAGARRSHAVTLAASLATFLGVVNPTSVPAPLRPMDCRNRDHRGRHHGNRWVYSRTPNASCALSFHRDVALQFAARCRDLLAAAAAAVLPRLGRP